MNAALKTVALPRLRLAGFTGSFPHLRRINRDGADLVTFQFNRSGGSLVVEIARCHPTGISGPLGHTPVSKAKAWDRHPNNRYRIQRQGSDWFDFEHEQPEVLAEVIADELVEGDVWLNVSPDGTETPYAK